MKCTKGKNNSQLVPCPRVMQGIPYANLKTLIIHQHNGSPYKLPTQHTMKFNMNNCQRWVNLVVHIGELTQHIIMHVDLPNSMTILAPINTPKGKTFHTRKITHPIITSKVVNVVCCMCT